MTDDVTSQDSMVIERTFDAPVELVWQMWTNPDHFRAWYGPDGATIPVANLDVRVGGRRHVCMEIRTPDGPMQMWFAGEHREVVENERLVYTESGSDEHGVAPPPGDAGMQPGHPTMTEVHVELEDLGSRTKMVLTHVGIADDSPGAAGWKMALDKLASHIATRANPSRSDLTPHDRFSSISTQ